MNNWGLDFEYVVAPPSDCLKSNHHRQNIEAKRGHLQQDNSSSTTATVSTRSTIGSMKSTNSKASSQSSEWSGSSGGFGPDYEEAAFPYEEPQEDRTPPPQRSRPRRRASIGVVTGPSTTMSSSSNSSRADREGPSSGEREHRRSGDRHRSRGASRGNSGKGLERGSPGTTSTTEEEDFARGIRATKCGTGAGRPDGKSPATSGRRVRNSGRRMSIGGPVQADGMVSTSHSAPSDVDYRDCGREGTSPQLFASKNGSGGRRPHQSRRQPRQHSPTRRGGSSGKSSSAAAADANQELGYGYGFGNDWEGNAAFEADFDGGIFGASSGTSGGNKRTPMNRRGSTGINRSPSPPEDDPRPTRSRGGRVNLDELRNGAFKPDETKVPTPRTTNMILPTQQTPKEASPPAQGMGRMRAMRRASLGGFVNNLGGAVGAVGDVVTGGIGGAVGVVGGAVGGAVGGLTGNSERMTKAHSSLDDDGDDDARKKRGFFKDRKDSKAKASLPNMSRPQVKRSNSEDSLTINAKLNQDRRRHGTLLQRFEASGKTKKLTSGERSNYSDRIMMGP